MPTSTQLCVEDDHRKQEVKRNLIPEHQYPHKLKPGGKNESREVRTGLFL